VKSYTIDTILKEVYLNKPVDEDLNTKFSDFTSYLSGMAKGVVDKLFFLKFIKPDMLVDFGSADGFILKQIHKYNPNINLIGYDISPDMITIAKEKIPDIQFTNNWLDAIKDVKRYKNSCLLLSSVIHEVYSYSTSEAIEYFWESIFNAGFEYIVIRDTIPSEKIEKVINFKKDVEQVKKIVDPKLLDDYENSWGPIDKSYKNFIRFVLMYRYRNNWSRERLEDYLSLTYESMLLKILPKYNDRYKIIYDKKFKFKPIQTSFAKDFNIPLRQDIHLKMILRHK
jgi:SAM-dependent methyltransferase